MRNLLLLVLAFTSATATRQRSRFTRYRSWNSEMYPVWQDDDPRFRNCWLGGEVTFTLKNDAPTLTGAKTTFNININFPPNQTVLPDGQVVWAQDHDINGEHFHEGNAVYPNSNTNRTGVFPDGTPFTYTQNRKPQYVFVWKTLGRYWQVADGPSSSLSIGTDNTPLGSYNMEVVIYHCRGEDKFIPLGYASTVFTITDQVPFSVSLAQVNDVNQNDQNFIQNQAIAFTINLHDPSQYLSGADISFSWDFGDNTGTLISRERSVTHTFLSVGTFRPQVVLMASIPRTCDVSTAVAPVDASAAPEVVVMASTPSILPAEGGDTIALDTDAADVDATNAENGEAAVVPDTAAAEAPAVDAAVEDAAAEETDAAVAATVAPVDTADEDEAAGVIDADSEDAATVATAAAEGEEAVADIIETVTAAPDAAAEVNAAAEATVEGEAADAIAADATPAAEGDATAAPAAEGDAAAEDAAEEAAAAAEADAAAAPATDVTVVAEVDAAAEDDVAAAPAADVTGAVDAAEATEAAAEVVQTATEAPAENIAAPAETVPAVEETEAEVVETENEAATAADAVEEVAVPAEGAVQAEVEAEPAQVALVLAKRQAPEATDDCTIYRYGSRAATVEVVQGIESIEIVQMSSVMSLMSELEQNAVDVTITCQGSLPSEVCTVVSDADCITPIQSMCSAASPSPDCQMILRQFFNETGVFCLNVSLTNDVSLAVASARVNVAVASGGSPAGTAATVLGVMLVACIVCSIGLMYRRYKQYQPLIEDLDSNNGGRYAVTSVPLLLWNLLSRQSPGESRPLLAGRIV